MDIVVNGKKFSFSGGGITISDNVIYVDGKEVANADKEKIEIHGDVGSVKCDRSVTVNGSVKGNVDADGSVNCDDVEGNVQSGGSVNCDDVGGSVQSGGSINCDDVGGSVVAGGSVRKG